MTVAVLLPAVGAAPAGAAAALVAQWRDAGAAASVEVAGDLPAQLRRVAALARDGSGPLLLCGTDVVAQTAVLLTVATEPGGGSVALVGPARPDRPFARVRDSRGFVTAAWPARPAAVPAGGATARGSTAGATTAGATTAGGGTAGGIASGGRAPAVDGDGASGELLGVLRVGVRDLPALAAAADRLADELAGGPPAGSAADGDAADGDAGTAGGAAAGTAGGAVDLLLPALVAAGARVGSYRLRLLVGDRVRDDAEAAVVRERMAAVDEDAARLRLAIKERDDFFTTFFVNPVSPRVVRWAARAGLSPTAVTGLSVALAIVAALGFAWGHRAGLVGGAVLLYLSFVLDCVDGQLARYSRRFSPVGGWLDTMADRSKEYLVYAGLAIGAERAGLDGAWALAVAAMALQTVRHMTDTWYGALHDEAALRAPAAATGGLLGRASERVQADTGSLAYWLKRIVVFPIGERWALIGVTAALFNGRVTLIAVLVWSVLAFAYTLALRSLRARGMRVAVLTVVDTAHHRDDGPLARALGGLLRRHDRGDNGQPAPMRGSAIPLIGAAFAAVVAAVPALLDPGDLPPAALVAVAAAVIVVAGLPAGLPHGGALDWLIPAALRAAEYLFVIGVARACDVPLPLLFVLLFALALRHYDLTARMEKRAATAPRRRWDIGWDGRVLVLGVGAAAGAATATVAVLAAYVFAVFAAGALAAYAPVGRRGAAAAGGPGR